MASASSWNDRRRRRCDRRRSAPEKSNNRAIPAPSDLKKPIIRLLILGFGLLRPEPLDVAFRVLAFLGRVMPGREFFRGGVGRLTAVVDVVRRVVNVAHVVARANEPCRATMPTLHVDVHGPLAALGVVRER